MTAPRPRVALHRVSTVEALSTALRGEILDGTLPAGSALREAELSDTFGVSRHTVRTALQALTHEGILRHEPNRGAFVPDLTAQDVDDVFRLRAVLETDAVQALARGKGDRSHLRRMLEVLESLGPSPEWHAVRDADLAFHQAIVDAIDSPRISRTYATLLTELRLCFLQLRPEFEDHGDVVRQHRELFAAVEAGDARAAAKQLKAHLEQSRKDIVSALPGDR
jgi:DNA-binding GntR family transcriptional regulator